MIVFNPKGYLLISALEKVPNPPVLFFSEEKFDIKNVNPGLSVYIVEFLATHTKEYRVPSPGEDRDGDGAWDDGRDSPTGNPKDSPYYHYESLVQNWTSINLKPALLKTEWYQGGDFKAKTPIINGIHAPAGCVAIAVGQLMNYHRRSRNFYSWNIIGNKNDPQFREEVSRLIYDIGVGVDMDYGREASGANSEEDVPPYLATQGYNTSIKGFNFSDFKHEIDQKRPVYLRAYHGRTNRFFGWWYSYYDGHAWIGDGYKEITNYKKYQISTRDNTYYTTRSSTTSYIHMNWGWGYLSNSSENWVTYNYWRVDNSNFKYKKLMITVTPKSFWRPRDY